MNISEIDDDWVERNEKNLKEFFFFVKGDMYRHRYGKMNYKVAYVGEYTNQSFVNISFYPTDKSVITNNVICKNDSSFHDYVIWLRGEKIDKLL